MLALKGLPRVAPLPPREGRGAFDLSFRAVKS
jgi:hypothetical protein